MRTTHHMYVIVMIKEKLQFLGYFGKEDQCTCTYITRIYTLISERKTQTG